MVVETNMTPKCCNLRNMSLACDICKLKKHMLTEFQLLTCPPGHLITQVATDWSCKPRTFVDPTCTSFWCFLLGWWNQSAKQLRQVPSSIISRALVLMNSTNIVTYFENSSNFTYDLHPPKSIVPNRPKHCSFTGNSIQHLHHGWETAGNLGFFASWEAMPMSQSPKYRRSQNRGHKNERISSTYHQISNMKVGFGGFSSMFSNGTSCAMMASSANPAIRIR